MVTPAGPDARKLLLEERESVEMLFYAEEDYLVDDDYSVDEVSDDPDRDLDYTKAGAEETATDRVIDVGAEIRAAALEERRAAAARRA